MRKGTKAARRQLFQQKRALKREMRLRPQEKQKSRVKSKDRVTIYRGTKVIRELEVWHLTDGYICTEAMQDGYKDFIARYDLTVERALNTALEASNLVLSVEQERWGGPDAQHKQHSHGGGEYLKGKRPAMSWTTDYDQALYFANHQGSGFVFRALVHPN
jgi:hypothetical protein